MHMRDCASVITLQTASGSEMERVTIRVPAVAPASIATMATERRCRRGLSPPAKRESAANPVIVSVSTVVVRSATPSFRTTAFLKPIATPVDAMTAYG